MPAVVTYDRLTQFFPAHDVTHLVAVHSELADATQVTAALRTLAEGTRGDALFAQDADPRIQTSADVTGCVRESVRPAER